MQRYSSHELIALLTAGLGGPTLRSRDTSQHISEASSSIGALARKRKDTAVRRT